MPLSEKEILEVLELFQKSGWAASTATTGKLSGSTASGVRGARLWRSTG